MTDAAAYQCDHDPDCYAVDANLARKMEANLSEVEDVVNASGTAIGNEHQTYSLAERVKHIVMQRDYFMRELDKARARLSNSNNETK